MRVLLAAGLGLVLTAHPSLTQSASQNPPADTMPDVQTIDSSVLTRTPTAVFAADVNRLIEVLFKIGARIESLPKDEASADARRELDRLRDDVAALHGRVRRGERGDLGAYQQLQKQLLALAQRVGSPLK